MQPRTSYNRKSSGEKLSSLLCTAGFVLSNATLKVEGGILKMQPREDIWERSLLRGRGRCGGCDHYWRICVGKLGGHRRKILTGKSKTTRGQGGCWKVNQILCNYMGDAWLWLEVGVSCGLGMCCDGP